MTFSPERISNAKGDPLISPALTLSIMQVGWSHFKDRQIFIFDNNISVLRTEGEMLKQAISVLKSTPYT